MCFSFVSPSLFFLFVGEVVARGESCELECSAGIELSVEHTDFGENGHCERKCGAWSDATSRTTRGIRRQGQRPGVVVLDLCGSGVSVLPTHGSIS